MGNLKYPGRLRKLPEVTLQFSELHRIPQAALEAGAEAVITCSPGVIVVKPEAALGMSVLCRHYWSPSLHGHVTTTTEKDDKDTNLEVKLLGKKNIVFLSGKYSIKHFILFLPSSIILMSYSFIFLFF